MASSAYNFQQTNFSGSFAVQSDGYMQGFAQDDPATRFALAKGMLGPNETFPMFGGVAISESLQTSGGNSNLGNIITRATSAANITGFAVFDQNFAANNTPFSNVPLIAPYGGVNFYRIGSGARIAVAIQPEVAASLQNSIINTAVTWDLNTQTIAEYQAAGSTIAATAFTPTFVPAANGAQAYWSISVTTAANGTGIPSKIGDVVNLSGFAAGSTYSNPAGIPYINQNQVVTSYTNTTTWGFNIANTSSTLFTNGVAVNASTTGVTAMPSLNYSGGTLAAKILDVNIGNSQIVTYNSVTGNANWLGNQSCALIQI